MASRRQRELTELGQCSEELEALANDEISRDPEIARLHAEQAIAASALADADRILPSQPDEKADEVALKSMAEELGF